MTIEGRREEAESGIFGSAVDASSARLVEGRRRGVITLLGDLATEDAATAVRMAAGVDIPEIGRAAFDGESAALRMADEELTLFAPYGEVAAKTKFLRETLGGGAYAVADMSDATIALQISGPGARETLAKVAPEDMHPRSFKQGDVVRTDIAAVAGVIIQVSEAPEVFEIHHARSVSDYVWDLISVAAEKSARIGLFAGS